MHQPDVRADDGMVADDRVAVEKRGAGYFASRLDGPADHARVAEECVRRFEAAARAAVGARSQRIVGDHRTKGREPVRRSESALRELPAESCECPATRKRAD